jgi:REP element-mobilizing transposase RayT
LPHWRIDGAWYYVTFCIDLGKLSNAEIEFVRRHIIEGSHKSYYLSALCVMPDHVHIILSPRTGLTLSQIMQRIKGGSAFKINNLRGQRGRLWQVEYWDRIIRSETDWQEKLGYMLRNPVEEGLTDDPWMWIGWYSNPDGS